MSIGGTRAFTIPVRRSVLERWQVLDLPDVRDPHRISPAGGDAFSFP